MATNSATVVAASLDSSQLEASINSLVNMVAQKTKAMADNFTSEVKRMENAVKNLGNIKIDSGGAADGGSSRRTSSLKQEEQQVKNVATSYDGLARAQQTAIGSRGGSALKKDIDEAANSYSGLIQQIERTQAKFDISPIQSLRMRQHELEAGMQTAANEAAKAKKDVDELNAAISNYRKTLETLPKDQQGFANRQAIQKEINDLVTLRDASASEQQKWTNAGKTLAAQYESVKGEIRQIGQALVDSEKAEKQVTSELDKQIQKIKEINSSKNAKAVYESISAMPNNTIEQANLKLQALQALKEKVANTPLLSKSSQSQLTQAITDTKLRIEQLENSVRGANQSKKSLDELNAAVVQNIRREEERRNTIIQTGIAAQEAFAKIRQSAQIQLADNTDKPIMGVKELTDAIRNMERAYWGMDVVNRESPLGQSLRHDMENAQKLRTAIEAYNKTLLGMSVVQDKSGVDKTLGSYTELSNILKRLSDEYRRLGREERNAAKGNDLADKIQRLGRETQKIQQQMNRPINLDAALKGSEKTIDDITYKIRRLQSYKVGIDLTKPNAANEIKQVDEAILRLQKDMDKYLGKSKDVLASNNALGRSWNYMKNRLAFYFTVGASTQFVKNLIDIRSQYEMNERALGILINSAERGTQIFNELSQMALVSPYTLIELSAAAKQLTAYDIAARDVVDTTRRLADMASAVGVPIERLTYALGQIKAYGYLNSRDARMFANAGIPLVKQLSDYYTELEGKMVSTADVYDRMKKKAIDYNSVMAVVTKMTDEGGKFFDFQAKMADTLKVRLANLTLAWNNMLNEMGKETQGVLTWSIGALRDLFLQWKNLYGALNEVALVLGVAKAFQFLGVCAHAAGVGFGSLNKYMTLNSLLGTRLAATVRTLGSAFMSLVHSPLAWFTMAALLVTEIGDAFINADRATKEFNKSLRDGAKTTYEDLKKFAEQYKNVRDSLYTTQKTAIGNYVPSTGKAAVTVYANQTVGQDISASEAKKVWEVMREQIELSSHASDEYISKLLSIENVSERLRQGFQILDDIQTVSAALKDIGDDGIKVTQGWSAWWNAWQGADGLIQNLKDLQKELQRLKDTGSDPDDKFVKVIDKDYHTALERFRKDLKVTTDSVIDFINLNGWSGDTGKIDEVFKQVTDRLVTQSNLDPQTAFTLQKDVEIARAKAAKEALEIRIADEKKALATASDEISKQQIQKNLETLEQQKRDFNKFNGENRAYWNDFTKYIKERHISELTAAYNSMTDHGKKAMDFQSKEWQKYVHDWANGYEKSHNLKIDSVFNRLRNWINDANTWSVFIKMTISTEDGKSVYKQLEEYDKAADDAWKTMQRLDKRISQLRKKGAKEVESAETGVVDLSRVSQDDRELTEALKERTQAQKDYNDAIEKGGESKKENAAASKAQKAAESELQKALKEELSIIDKIRSNYQALTKEGMNHADAIKASTAGYEKSARAISQTLTRFGLQAFDPSAFAGISDPNDLVRLLQGQLDKLIKSGKAKPAEIKDLEIKVNDVKLDAEKFNLTRITKGLNSELDKLKDEYELALELDANPELGNMFADWMGIDVSDLPRTASEYAERASKILNNKLKDLGAKTELPSVLDITDDDMRAFEENKVFTDKQLELVKKAVDAARGFQKKETEERIKDWDKLLEKYAEYETKVNKIQNNAVKERVTFAQQFGNDNEKSLALNLQTQILAATDPQEKQKLIQQLQELVKSIAGDDKTKLNIVTSINTGETRNLAKASFEEFQKSPEWITATGDIAGMTTRALGSLIDKLEKYKRSATNLNPKQIKNLNNALKSLYSEQKKNNPFKAISVMMLEAQNRALNYNDAIDDTRKEIDRLEKEEKYAALSGQESSQERLDRIEELKKRLEELIEKQKEAGELSTEEIVSAFNSVISIAKEATSVVTDFADALGGNTEGFKQFFSVLEKGGQGAATGAQVGGGWGAVIGGVLGIASGLISTFADELSGNAGITKSVKQAESAVKRLEIAYIDLQRAIDRAYGSQVVGAKQAMAAAKEMELKQLERQLELEESRESKNRDEDKILELKKQIKELKYEIKDTVEEITNDLMGTDAYSFAENLVSSMIQAFKQGEDYMKTFEESFDDMIDNLIMKSIVGRVVGEYMDRIWESVDANIQARSKNEADEYGRLQARLSELEAMDYWSYAQSLSTSNTPKSDGAVRYWEEQRQKEIEETKKKLELAKANYDVASQLNDSDISNLIQQLAELKPELAERLKELIGQWYTFGSDKDTDKNLSALQQGLQGVSESTASAVEAYLNGMSQQAYLRNDLLTQIRDAVVGFNLDVQVATMSQILLQLQSSYTVQMSIQGILEGWSSPSGLAVRVEMQ